MLLGIEIHTAVVDHDAFVLSFHSHEDCAAPYNPPTTEVVAFATSVPFGKYTAAVVLLQYLGFQVLPDCSYEQVALFRNGWASPLELVQTGKFQVLFETIISQESCVIKDGASLPLGVTHLPNPEVYCPARHAMHGVDALVS